MTIAQVIAEFHPCNTELRHFRGRDAWKSNKTYEFSAIKNPRSDSRLSDNLAFSDAKSSPSHKPHQIGRQRSLMLVRLSDRGSTAFHWRCTATLLALWSTPDGLLWLDLNPAWEAYPRIPESQLQPKQGIHIELLAPASDLYAYQRITDARWGVVRFGQSDP